MDTTTYSNNNWKNANIDSVVPSLCRKRPCNLGIDEAGRGPVLGPMVYSGCYYPKDCEDDVKSLGVSDSKVLTESKRIDILNLIHENNSYIGYCLEVLSPAYISNCMYERSKISLNEVSHNSAASLIRRIINDHDVLVENVFVDTVGDPAAYQAKLKEMFPALTITVSKKADSLYPSVSAASICAKVARDKILQEWKFPEDLSIDVWGSGYPGDIMSSSDRDVTLDHQVIKEYFDAVGLGDTQIPITEIKQLIQRCGQRDQKAVTDMESTFLEHGVPYPDVGPLARAVRRLATKARQQHEASGTDLRTKIRNWQEGDPSDDEDDSEEPDPRGEDAPLEEDKDEVPEEEEHPRMPSNRPGTIPKRPHVSSEPVQLGTVAEILENQRHLIGEVAELKGQMAAIVALLQDILNKPPEAPFRYVPPPPSKGQQKEPPKKPAPIAKAEDLYTRPTTEILDGKDLF